MSHLLLGTVFLLVVTGAFAVWFGTAVAVVEQLHLLSMTSFVFASLYAWVLLWLTLELA